MASSRPGLAMASTKNSRTSWTTSAVKPVAGRGTGNWTAFPGRLYDDAQCHDLGNPNNETAASCQKLCDPTPSCTAINAHSHGGGPCALRACRCLGAAAVVEPANDGGATWTAFARHCQVVAGFSSVFASAMVLQRAPLQARHWGAAAPHSTVMVTLAPQACDETATGPATFRAPSSLPSAVNVSIQVDAAGRWHGLLPPMPAAGPYAQCSCSRRALSVLARGRLERQTCAAPPPMPPAQPV